MVPEWEVKITATLRFAASSERDAQVVSGRTRALLESKLAPFLRRKQRMVLVTDVERAQRTGREVPYSEPSYEPTRR